MCLAFNIASPQQSHGINGSGSGDLLQVARRAVEDEIAGGFEEEFCLWIL
jgi:hypothetical protein